MIIIGHRGARGLAPENTIASLSKALEHGVNMIEFDVRVTKDNVPVLHHGSKIKINDRSLKIATTNFDDLIDLKSDLTRLDQALKFIKYRCLIYLEIKSGVDLKPILSVVSHVDKGLFIGSKDQSRLRQIHKQLPEIPLIVIEPWSGLRATRRARQVNTKYIAMNQLWLWRGFIQPIAKRGWKLMAYTVNDPAKARRWQGYGLYGFVTDYPDRFIHTSKSGR